MLSKRSRYSTLGSRLRGRPRFRGNSAGLVLMGLPQATDGIRRSRRARPYGRYRTALAYRSVAAPPVGRAQLPLEDLPRGVPGQPLAEVDRRRALVVGQALPGEGDDLLGVGIGCRGLHHDGLHGLSPLRAGHADDRNVGDVWVRHQDVLNLGRVHVLTARDDHVLDPVVDEEIAVGVDESGITGPEPAGRVRAFRGLAWLVPVADGVLERLDADFAHFAGIYLQFGLEIDDAHGRPLNRATGRG